MNIQVIIDDSTIKYDISELVTSIEWETTLLEQPGKLTLEYIDDSKTYFAEGSKIAVTVDDVGLFTGFVFKRSRSESTAINITAYDQMRYLQNKDIINMPQLTCSEVFGKICTDQKLEHKKVHESTYKCPKRLYDNKSYYEMIQQAFDDTLVATGEWFICRDNFGVLEHLKISELLTTLIIGDESLLTGYKFESEIDSDTYNVVKITKDNKKTAKREVYEVMDSDNINKWGRLQFYDATDEDANEAQIKAKADMILELKNRPTRTLSVECFGDKRVRAGNGIILAISALQNEEIPFNQNALVMSCTHKFETDKHIMSLELEIV